MVEDYYTDSLILLESSTEKDHGINKKTWSEIVDSDFLGKIILLNASEFRADGSNNYKATHKCVCPVSVNADRSLRIKDKNTSLIYNIVWVKQVRDHHKKILLEEVTDGQN